MSATVRAVQPLSDEIAIALPFRTDVSAFDALAVGHATRSLGTRLELEVAPRLSIGQFFGLSAAYLVRRWGADRYEGSDPASQAPLMSDGAMPSRTMHAAAFGASFSTLASYTRGRSRVPAEVIYSHTMPVAGSGGTVPSSTSDRLELRVYTGFPRR